MITCMWRTSLRNPLLLAMIFSMLSLSISVRAQTPPLADTYASSFSPKANYGKNTTLIVLSGTTSYIQFNLAGMPANTPISKATLRVFVDAVTASGSFDVYQLNSAWAENTLTYNKAPALGASATGGNPVLITSANLHDFVLVGFDSLLGFAGAVAILFYLFHVPLYIVLLGAFAGQMPDGLQFIYFNFHPKWMDALQRFHSRIQTEHTDIAYLGIEAGLILAVLALGILGVFMLK